MARFLATVIASVIFFVVVGSAVAIGAVQIVALIKQHDPNPNGVLVLFLRLYGMAILYVGWILGGPIGAGYGALLAVALRFPPILNRIRSKLRLALLGAFVAIICVAAVGGYRAFQKQKDIDAVYQGEVKKDAAIDWLWRDFWETQAVFLLLPTLVCGIAFPLLLRPPAVKWVVPDR